MPDTLQARRPPYPAAGSGASGHGPRDTEVLMPATQLVSDREAYLDNAPSDIGRRVSDEQHELFVVCRPAEAMQQQLAQLAPDFIAIHDLGAAISTRLLAAVAAASARKMQKLVIRRQGFGTALATIEFAELPLPSGKLLRIYTTRIDADTQTRQQLAQLLLAHSRLAVVMVGDLPPHALESSLEPLRQAIAAGPWPNRQLLLMPMGNAPSLPAEAASLDGAGGVMVRCTPQVGRPAEAWAFITGAWNRLNAADGTAPAAPQATPAAGPGLAARAPSFQSGTVPAARSVAFRAATADLDAHEPPPTAAAYAPTQPLELTPMPPARAAVAQPQTPGQAAVWAGYVQRCAAIKGVAQACVFDVDRQRPLAYSGAQRSAERLAAKGAMLLAVMADAADALALGSAPPDAAVTLAEHYLLLRPLPGRPNVALHLVIERSHGNLGAVRAALHQIDQTLPAPAG